MSILQIDRSTTRQEYCNLYGAILRKFQSEKPQDNSVIGRRARFVERVKRCTRNGFVLLCASGTDCDGYHWKNSHAVAALPRAIERDVFEQLEWADGVMSVWVEQATPDPSGPIHECRYNCDEAERVGDDKYVCPHSDHWLKQGEAS